MDYVKFIPLNDTRSLRVGALSGLTASEKNKWRAFTNYLTRTPFMSHLLHTRQNGICPICEQPVGLNESQIHHIDYNHLCHYDTWLLVKRPTIIRPKRTIKIAKCETCEDREGCTSRTVLIHKKCHIYLHVKEGRIIRRADRHDRQIELFPAETES